MDPGICGNGWTPRRRPTPRESAGGQGVLEKEADSDEFYPLSQTNLGSGLRPVAHRGNGVDEGVSLPEMQPNNGKLDMVPFHCVINDYLSDKMCPTHVPHRIVPSIVIPPHSSADHNDCMTSNFESRVANRPNTPRIGSYGNSSPTEYACGFDTPNDLFANSSELGTPQGNEALTYNTGLGIGTTNDSSGTNDLLPFRYFGQDLPIPDFVYENRLPLSQLGNGHDSLSQSDTAYRQHEYRGHVAGEVFSLTGSQSPHSQSSADFPLHNQPNDLGDPAFSDGHLPRSAETIGAFAITSFRNRSTPYHDDAFSISPSSNTAAEFVNLAYDDSNDLDDWDMIDDRGQALSSYAASDAGSTRTRDTSITMTQDFTYLPVPGHPSRRSSDPNPAAPNGLSQSSMRRTSSTKSRGSGKNIKNYPRAPSQPRCIVRKGADPVGPRIHHVQMPPRARGKRVRNMNETEKAAMNLAKLTKHTCVRCKWGKVTCQLPDGAEQCTGCEKASQSGRHPMMCIRADVVGLVESGPTNLIAQHYIYPLRTDGIHRSRLDVPITLKFNHILPLINQLRQSYDVRVSQGDIHLYDLDLDGCFSHLTSLQGSLPNETPLRDIMEKTLLKRSDWQICVKNPHLLDDVTSSLHNLVYWGIMPSRVTVRLVSKKDGYLKRLDPDKHADKRILLAVAQLSRIVGRGLEHAAFQRLQTHLQLKAVTLTVDFLQLLGHLVLSLRWRISWWKALGIDRGAAAQTQRPDEQEEATKRLRGICETLFVYFCSHSRQQNDWNENKFRGRSYRYPDTELEVFEEFPRGDSRADIEEWMKKGEDKIREARVEERLKFIGLL